MKRVLFLLCLPLLLSACGYYNQRTPLTDDQRVEKVAKKAAYDFQCRASDLTLVRSNTTTFNVSGCDKSATYLLRGSCESSTVSMNQPCKAVLDSEITVNTQRGYP